jgi:alkaline phosphatase D
MSRHSRRDFLAAFAAASAAALPAAAVAGRGEERRPDRPRPTFAHGVASGDPLQDRVILWTRVTPRRPDDEVEGRWRVARDPAMRHEVARGAFATDISRDFTVKIDVADLAPGSVYYYRFETRGVRSPVGRTKTLPRGRTDSLRLAFVSCSNYPYGYFNAYARIAERADLDLVLHLGDYLYEYKVGEYANPRIAGQRDVVPDREIVALTDYRLRHAQYKTDPDLQEVHRQHPFVCVWDDHESTNDSWKDGAENHDPDQGEGEWEVRKRAAIRAYNEWMPIRSRGLADDRIWRSFRYGNLADLIMLDTRLHGRDLQAAFKGGVPEIPANDPTVSDPNRTLLGFDQEQWLNERLSTSRARGAPWRLIGQQVMMAQLSFTRGATYLNPDQWDGYRPARERLYEYVRGSSIDGVVVMTGDIHSSWAHDLASNPWGADYAARRGIVGVEFVAPAVSSPGPLGEFPTPQQLAPLQALPLLAPHTKYAELVRRGYVLLDVTRDRVQGEFWHVDTIDRRSTGEVFARALYTEAGSPGLQVATGPSMPRSAADPAPADEG